MSSFEAIIQRGPRVLRYSVPQSEIAGDEKEIMRLGRIVFDAKTPGDLIRVTGIQTSRIREQAVVPVEYNLSDHVRATVRKLIAQSRWYDKLDMGFWKATILGLNSHDTGKTRAINGDHPHVSADYAEKMFDILVREGFVDAETRDLAVNIARLHHGLGDVVHGWNQLSESALQRIFPTEFSQIALVAAVKADMHTWDQGQRWWKEDIEPAMSAILPKAGVVFSGLDRGWRLG
ncbi:MAG: hypothetical protein HZB10_00765 [Candidatus Yonathbacteria bacterium]|nr:hypothetical protein [Candidatus Yonathbacteria bacterium]